MDQVPLACIGGNIVDQVPLACVGGEHSEPSTLGLRRGEHSGPSTLGLRRWICCHQIVKNLCKSGTSSLGTRKGPYHGSAKTLLAL